MGFAIILIMICHSTLYFDNLYVKSAYNHIKQFCKIGVDIFFILSGIGLTFSIKNDNNRTNFYKKRFRRLFPAYCVVIASWAIISITLNIESMQNFIWKYSLISFFISGELAEWYVAAIAVLYILFPALYFLVNKNKKIYVLLTVLIYIISLWISLTNQSDSKLRVINEAFVVRVPAFLIGIAIGNEMQKANSYIFPIKLLGTFCFIMLIADYVWNPILARWIERVLFLPIALLLCVLVSNILDVHSSKALRIIGRYTFEIYLVHEKILLIYDNYTVRCMVGSFFSNFAAVIITIFSAIIVAKIVDRMVKLREYISYDR